MLFVERDWTRRAVYGPSSVVAAQLQEWPRSRWPACHDEPVEPRAARDLEVSVRALASRAAPGARPWMGANGASPADSGRSPGELLPRAGAARGAHATCGRARAHTAQRAAGHSTRCRSGGTRVGRRSASRRLPRAVPQEDVSDEERSARAASIVPDMRCLF